MFGRGPDRITSLSCLAVPLVLPASYANGDRRLVFHRRRQNAEKGVANVNGEEGGGGADAYAFWAGKDDDDDDARKLLGGAYGSISMVNFGMDAFLLTGITDEESHKCEMAL